MTIEVRPLGVQCNIQCQYCYQLPTRDADRGDHDYDLAAIFSALQREGGPFSLFGGEPLLVPLRDLEKLWSWGYQRYGQNSLQTNGVLITPEHLEVFERYHVRVGISIDGPDELNDARWAGTLERTRSATRKSEAAIDALCERKRPPSLIVTLHRHNASSVRIPQLLKWFDALASQGVTSLRLHLLEVDTVDARALQLTTDENIRAIKEIRRWYSDNGKLHIDIFEDALAMLRARDKSATCIWLGCDPYTTRAVRGIDGRGQRTNCGRTNKDGVEFEKGDRPGYERYLALAQTPQKQNGCAGCRFFLVCKGQCPGTAVDGDWRNRSEHCDVWKSIFADAENHLQLSGELPLSLWPNLPQLTSLMLGNWMRGENPSLTDLVKQLDAH